MSTTGRLDRMRAWPRWRVLPLLALAYFLMARGSLLLSFEHANVSPIWPPTGLAIAALLIWGARAWPAIFCGALLANALSFYTNTGALNAALLAASLTIAIGNTLEALLASWLIGRWAPKHGVLDNFLAVFGLVGAVGVASLLSASIGTFSLLQAGVIPETIKGAVMLTWWLGDSTGGLVVVPVLWSLVAHSRLASEPRFTPASGYFWLILTVSGLVCWALFNGAVDDAPHARLFLLLPLVGLAGAALFAHVRGASIFSLMVAATAVWGTTHGHGPFVIGSMNDSLILLDAFLALCVIAGLLWAADLTERRELQTLSASLKVQGLILPWGGLLASLAVTMVVWHGLNLAGETAADARFASTAANERTAIVQRMTAQAQTLRGGVGLLKAKPDVTRQEWRTYVEGLELERNYPGIQGVGYAKQVLPAERKAFEEAVRAEGFAGFSITPAGQRELYTPIVFLEPFDARNRRAFGFDMYSEATRRAAMVLARDNDRMAISGKVRLVQENGQAEQPGFLMYIPIYRQGAVLRTSEQRRAAVLGYVYSPLRAYDWMQGFVGENLWPNVHMTVYDGEKVDAQALLYQDNPATLAEVTAQNHRLQRTTTITIGQHAWTIVQRPTVLFAAGLDRQTATVALVAGMGLSLMLFVVLRTLLLTRTRAQALALKITADLRAAQHLSQEREAMTQAIFTTAPVGLLLLDAQGSVMQANAVAEKIFAYTQGSLQGVQVEQLMPQRYAAAHSHLRQSFVNARVSRPMADGRDVLGKRADGSEIPLEISLCSLSQQGEQFVIAAVLDISDRKQAALALAQSELRFRRLYNESPVMLHSTNAEGCITQVSQLWLDQLGYTQEQVLGQPVLNFLTEASQVLKREKMRRFVLAEETAFKQLPLRMRCADGRVIDVLLSASAEYDTQQRFVQGLSVMLDVTEKKRSEAVLRELQAFQAAILQSASHAIIATDIQGLVRSLNPAAEDLLGYRSSELVGRVTPALWHDEKEVVARSVSLSQELGLTVEPGFEVFVAKARGGMPEKRPWTYIRKDGTRVPVELSVSALIDGGGRLSGFLGIAVDVSQRLAFEAQQVAALQEKELLLKEVYHRVKNNLQVVDSLFNLQLRSLPEGQASEALRDSAARVRAMALVHEKLYRSKSLETIELPSYVADLCRSLAASSGADARGIVLKLEVEALSLGLETAVPLGLLLNELIANSVKHGVFREQGGQVSIHIAQNAQGRGVLRVINPAPAPSAADEAEKSTSMGLKLVRILSKQLDGSFRIESDGAQRVSEVTFRLEEPLQANRSQLSS